MTQIWEFAGLVGAVWIVTLLLNSYMKKHEFHMNRALNLLLMAVITVALFLIQGLTMWTVKGILLALILLTASVQDATSHEADDFLSVMLLILAFVDFSVDKVLSMLLGAVCVFVPLYLITLFSKSGFGGADIKITTAAALSLGAFGSVISGIGGIAGASLPSSLIQTIEDCGFWESIPLWAVTLIGSLLVWVLSFVMILTVYGRFFKLYLYTAIAPVPLSAFAGEETSHVGRSFLKSYVAVCLEGAIIVLACIIYTLFASSPPSVDVGASAITQVWSYIGEVLFNMFVLVGTIKLSDHVVKDMMGL